MLSVSVLGPLRVSRDDVVVEIGSRRQRLVVAALAVRFPESVLVDGLVDAVWDDDPPAGARGTLQSYVSRLRAVLGADAIDHEHAGYRLHPGTVVDVAEVRRALADAERLVEVDRAGAVDLARGALARWNGPTLGEFATMDWFMPVAVGLDRVRHQLRLTSAAGCLGCGWPADAVELLSTMVAEDPLDEPATVLLVQALASSGHTVEATRAASRFRRVLREETGLDPSPELSRVEQAILSGELTVRGGVAQVGPTVTAPGRVLSRPSRLIGRADELAALSRTIEQSRLVTILGTGGVGKTRLMAELAAELTAASRDVVVTELIAVGPGEVVDAVAVAFGYRIGRAEPRTLVEIVGARDVVVVLDNCERVVASVRDLVRVLLDSCPNLRIVTTSRTRLALADEQVVPLQPLVTIGDRPPAVELFAERLQQAHPTSDVDVDAEAVRRLCRQLDGLPLAIELAAGRAAVLGVEAIADHLQSSIELLATPVEAGEHRHASVEAVVRWSYDLLGPAAQALFAALAVFEDEFDLAAVTVVGAAVIDQSVGPVFERLIDTCLVGPGRSIGSFRLLEVVRRIAEQQLARGGHAATVRGAHARWVATEVGRLAVASTGPDDAAVASRLESLRADLRRALDHAVATGDVATSAAVADGVAALITYRPDAELAASVLRAATAPAAIGSRSERTLAAAGSRAAWLIGDLDRAETLARQALAASTRIDHDHGAIARAHHTLAVLSLYAGDFDRAGAEFRLVADSPDAAGLDRFDALGGAALAAAYAGRLDDGAIALVQQRAIADALGSSALRAFTDYVDAELALARGERPRAVALLERSAQAGWKTGARLVWGLASTVLAATLVRSGALEQAAHQLPLLLQRWRVSATWPQLWTSLRLSAIVLAGLGRVEDAGAVLAAAEADASAPEVPDAVAVEIDEVWRALAERRGASGVAAARARAAVLDRHDVLDLAIRALDDTAAT